MANGGYAVGVVSAEVGRVVATATYPQDGRYYSLRLHSASYDVYKVVQEFSGWDASQPLVFEDTFQPLAAGEYTLELRERYQCHGHDMCWRTLASVPVTV